MKNILDYASLAFKVEPEKLHPEAYIFRNFINSEDSEHFRYLLSQREPNPQDGSVDLPELNLYRQKVLDLFNKEISVTSFDKVTVHNEGGMDLHHDVISYEILDLLVPDNYPNKTKIKLPCYTFLFYLNDDYEGGEISYPEYNVDHKPTRGDLVIHTTEVIHGVKKIKSGMRYRMQGIVFDDVYDVLLQYLFAT